MDGDIISPDVHQEIRDKCEDMAMSFAMGEDCSEEELKEIISKLEPILSLLTENIAFDEVIEPIFSLHTMLDSFKETLGDKQTEQNTQQIKKIKDMQEEVAAMAATCKPYSAGGSSKTEDAEEDDEQEEAVKLGDDELLIYREFVNESFEHLETIEEKILQMEEEPNNLELTNEVFRPFHSMKGSAGFMGLTQINMLAHETETMLDCARKGTLIIRRNAVDVLLEAVDRLKSLVENTSGYIEEGLAPLEATDIDIYKTIAKVKDIIKNKDVKEQNIGDILIEEGAISTEELESAVFQQNKRLGEILVEQGAATNRDVKIAVNVQKAQGRRLNEAIKVNVEKLDALMELVGELVISQTLIAQNPSIKTLMSEEVCKEMLNLGKICNGIQENVMLIRMVVLKQTFQKMNRLVRDLSQKTKKDIELVISGENTEIDKTIIDQINDPLVHLIRNSIDHGIELPHEREAAGKPRTGTINLDAFHSCGKVVIEIKDDGNGLKKEKILKKAIEKGLTEDGANYTEQQIMNFIFSPGFSTVDKATDISGRGVGMDVVKQNIEGLGGDVSVSSVEGRGSVFTIKLPLTTAIVDGMVVKVDNEKYIIPTIAIRETISPKESDVNSVHGVGEMVRVRKEVIPIVRLHKVLGTGSAGRAPWKSLLIIVENNGKKNAIMVDDLLGQQQVVIKSLGKKLSNVKGVSGASILGDGKIGLILDIPSIISLM